jgi:putative RecB family exonuclease
MSEPGQLPEYLSASSIGTFQQCPLKYKLSRIDQISEPPTMQTLMGNFVHEVLEEMYSNFEPDERTIQLARTICTTMWESGNWAERVAPYLGRTTMNELRWMCWWCIENLFGMEDPKIVTPSGVECEVNGELNGVNIKGFIDRWSIENGVAKITDYKTGKTPSKRYMEGKFFQLTLYAAMLAKDEEFNSFNLELLYLKDGVRLEGHASPEDINEVITVVTNVKEQINKSYDNNDWTAIPSKLCDWCIYKKTICTHWN